MFLDQNITSGNRDSLPKAHSQQAVAEAPNSEERRLALQVGSGLQTTVL